MAGNVWEWTSSVYKKYPYRADDGREDMGASGARVLRGGSFLDIRTYARVSSRYGDVPGERYVYYGVRVGVGCARA